MPSLGEQIKTLRVRRGMTQEQLAQKLNTTKAAVSRYEKDQRQPRLEQISEIAKALDASPEEIFNLIIGSQHFDSDDYSDIDTRLNAINAWIDTICNVGADKDSSSHPTDEEKEEIRRLADIFLKLSRYFQRDLLEYAESSLKFQEERNSRVQRFPHSRKANEGDNIGHN